MILKQRAMKYKAKEEKPCNAVIKQNFEYVFGKHKIIITDLSISQFLQSSENQWHTIHRCIQLI